MLGVSGARAYFPQHRTQSQHTPKRLSVNSDGGDNSNNKYQRNRHKSLSLNSNELLHSLQLNDDNQQQLTRSHNTSPINIQPLNNSTAATNDNNTNGDLKQRSSSDNELYLSSLQSIQSPITSINPDTQKLIELLSSTVQLTSHDHTVSDASQYHTQLHESTAAAIHILNKLTELSTAVIDRLQLLLISEKQLSTQAGHLLRQVQVDEQLMNKLNTALRDTKLQRKQLLSDMTAPRWEVKHHYHMTVFEHSLGHKQPHVLDVAEMLPGHLRLYAISRIGALTKRAFSTTLHKAKSDRIITTEQIKLLYKQLKDTRSDIKHVNELIDSIRTRVKQLRITDTPVLQHNHNGNNQQQIVELHSKLNDILDTRNTISNQRINPFSFNNTAMNQSFRSKYLASLNIAPVKFDTSESSINSTNHLLHRIDINESNWQQMHSLLGALESHSMSVRQMHERRRQIGIDSLPSPRKLNTNNNDDTQLNNDINTDNKSNIDDTTGTDIPIPSPEYKSTDLSNTFNFDSLRLDHVDTDHDTPYNLSITPIDTPNNNPLQLLQQPNSAYQYQQLIHKSTSKPRSYSTKL